ncbi:MAG: DUF4232 domain-containing protein [Jatrophihabitantaceae bacterium]
MSRTARRATAAAVAAVGLAAAACTSSGTSTPSSPVSSPAPSTTPVSSASPSSTPASTSTPPSPSSTAPSTTPPKPTSTAPSSSSPAPPPGPPRCAAAQLSASGLRGGAGQGIETAGVQFTNTSRATCTVRGYPFAQLQYRGSPLGRPASHEHGPVRTITLRPGASAQSLLQATTTCQAPVSDHAVVRAPNTSRDKTVAVELRGCSLSIAPLERA